MDKKDFIDLIKVAESILRMEEGVKILSGTDLGEGEASKVYLIWDILRRNATERFCVTDNSDMDADNYQEFVEILESKELTAEEKYERLIEKNT